jgi:predicted Fe-S protein YdhL (DUF1289 family)
MTSYTITRGGIATPCVGICTINPQTQTCNGCKRTRAELKLWLRGMTQKERLRIITEELPKR